MPAPSQPAAIAPESATTALYRAALGTVNVGRYLPVFARFDEQGRAGPSWNWAAALLTLNWLVFRQLWGAALMYVAAVEGLALLVLGLGRDGLAWPGRFEWVLLGAIFVLGCLIPGAYGNAWLHADARRRMTRAVHDAKTVREACAALAQRASTRQRLVGLLLINVLVVAAAAGIYAGLSRWMADQQTPPAVVLPVEAVPADVEPTVSPVASDPAEPTDGAAEETARAAASPPESAGETAEAAEPTLLEPAQPAVVTIPPTVEPTPVPLTLAQPTRPAVLETFAINVGLFAEASNADRVHTRLLDAGLPAYIQVVDFPNGQRTRVRVGPFADRARADEAAARIQALGLDAVVFRQ